VADLTTTIDTHLAAYCEPDAGRRAALVAEVWSPQGQLVDPPMEGEGLEAIVGLGDVVVTHYPGHTFKRTTNVDEHHGHARHGWALVAADGNVAVTGTDIATVDADGRLVKVVGFFGDLEAA